MQEESSTHALGDEDFEALEILSRYPWVRLGDRNDPLLPAVDGAGSSSPVAQLTERGLATWSRFPVGAHARITNMGRRFLATRARETARGRLEAEREARERWATAGGPPPVGETTFERHDRLVRETAARRRRGRATSQYAALQPTEWLVLAHLCELPYGRDEWLEVTEGPTDAGTDGKVRVNGQDCRRLRDFDLVQIIHGTARPTIEGRRVHGEVGLRPEPPECDADYPGPCVVCGAYHHPRCSEEGDADFARDVLAAHEAWAGEDPAHRPPVSARVDIERDGPDGQIIPPLAHDRDGHPLYEGDRVEWNGVPGRVLAPATTGPGAFFIDDGSGRRLEFMVEDSRFVRKITDEPENPKPLLLTDLPPCEACGAAYDPATGGCEHRGPMGSYPGPVGAVGQPSILGHDYPGAPGYDLDNPGECFTSDCTYGCGCYAGPTTSGGPPGVDPWGACPKNPAASPVEPESAADPSLADLGPDDPPTDEFTGAGSCPEEDDYLRARAQAGPPPPGIARQQATLGRPMHSREVKHLEGLGAGVYEIAYCPDHGLHGRRETCNECGGPVRQVPMLALAEDPLIRDEQRRPPNPWARLGAEIDDGYRQDAAAEARAVMLSDEQAWAGLRLQFDGLMRFGHEVSPQSNAAALRDLGAIAFTLARRGGVAPPPPEPAHVHEWGTTGTKDTGSDPPAYRWDCAGCDEQIWCSDPDGPDGKRLRAEGEATVGAVFEAYPQEKLWAYLLTIPAMLISERPTGDEVRHELRIVAAAARSLSDRGEQPMETHRLDSSDEKLYEALGRISAAVYGPEPEPAGEVDAATMPTPEEVRRLQRAVEELQGAAGMTYRPPVATAIDLPAEGNEVDDVRFVLDASRIYRWDSTGWHEWPLILDERLALADEIHRLQRIVTEAYEAHGVLAVAVYGNPHGWTSFAVLAKRAVEELQARDRAIAALNAEGDRMEDAEEERERRRAAHRLPGAGAPPSRRFDDPGHVIAAPGDGPVPLPLMTDEQLARLRTGERAQDVLGDPPPSKLCERCGGERLSGVVHGPGACLDRRTDRMKEADEARRRAEADRTREA